MGSDIWQHVGWGTIIYLATLSGVNQSLHEAAAIDGAGRMRRILHVNLPAIMPVIVIHLIMRVGRMMLVGFDKVILLYSPPPTKQQSLSPAMSTVAACMIWITATGLRLAYLTP